MWHCIALHCVPFSVLVCILSSKLSLKLVLFWSANCFSVSVDYVKLQPIVVWYADFVEVFWFHPDAWRKLIVHIVVLFWQWTLYFIACVTISNTFHFAAEFWLLHMLACRHDVEYSLLASFYLADHLLLSQKPFIVGHIIKTHSKCNQTFHLTLRKLSPKRLSATFQQNTFKWNY